MLESPYSVKFNKNMISYLTKSLQLVNQQVTFRSIYTQNGTSETTREITENKFDFSLFLAHHLPLHKKTITVRFLEWFVGFSEGDGSFTVSKNRLFFIIVQKEASILFKIKTALGFGSVTKHGAYWRFIIADKRNCERLIYLFNGNLLLDKTNARFFSWVSTFNFTAKIPCTVKNKLTLTNHLNTSWLTGFIDAEGCFNVNLTQNKRQNDNCKVTIRLRFLLDQSDEYEFLQSLRIFFTSSYIEKRKLIPNRKSAARFTITSLIGAKEIIKYLKKYPLQTTKILSFQSWVRVFFILINKQHLTYTCQDIANLQKSLKKYKDFNDNRAKNKEKSNLSSVKDIVRS